MAAKDQFPIENLDVAVTVIERGGLLLAVYNEKWSSFTLPMTKRRQWKDPEVPGVVTDEEWIDAAARAAAEWLGRTSTTDPKHLSDTVPEFHQSDRDGRWKHYRFQVFQVSLEEGREPRSGAVAEWLTPEQFLDEERRPISPTARYLIGKLKGEAILQGRAFP